jgi:2-keto-4-pentenoate hydratase/2-oxohepta-3-ene-1,7-dioic acid hydratase in catechol pathway
MGMQVVRFTDGNQISWGVVGETGIQPVAGNFSSLGMLLTEGMNDLRSAAEQTSGGIEMSDVKLLSPVTAPARIVCQGANYATHRAEAGMQPERPAFNLIFTKSDTSLSGPTDNIVRPANVGLLDYEIEIGLVIGKSINSPTHVSADNFTEYVAGIVIANDVSARDVQLIEGQWFKGKSYRTFCPVGPYVYLLDENEGVLVHDLDLKLWVNGEIRQSANTSQLLFKPEETLTELSEIVDFAPGDLVLTGTPGGVALHLSGTELARLTDPTVSTPEKRELLMRSQSDSAAYLQDGDEIVCEVKSADGRTTLGMQKNRVVSA